MEMLPASLELKMLPDFEFLVLYSLGVLRLSLEDHQSHLQMENLPAFLEPFPVWGDHQSHLQTEKHPVFLEQNSLVL
jgi:hypothetical protein